LKSIALKETTMSRVRASTVEHGEGSASWHFERTLVSSVTSVFESRACGIASGSRGALLIDLAARASRRFGSPYSVMSWAAVLTPIREPPAHGRGIPDKRMETRSNVGRGRRMISTTFFRRGRYGDLSSGRALNEAGSLQSCIRSM